MDLDQAENIAMKDQTEDKISNFCLTGGYLLGLIAEEDTCVGFLLAGIGESKKIGDENFLAVNEKTNDHDILEFFEKLNNRQDIAIILIEKHIANRIKGTVKFFKNYMPIILEIPSKSCPFKVEEDHFLQRAAKIYEENREKEHL